MNFRPVEQGIIYKNRRAFEAYENIFEAYENILR